MQTEQKIGETNRMKKLSLRLEVKRKKIVIVGFFFVTNRGLSHSVVIIGFAPMSAIPPRPNSIKLNFSYP